MELYNNRIVGTKLSTLSHFFIEDKFECYILEDPVRKTKVYGKTAIPEGRFRVKLRTVGSTHKKYLNKRSIKKLGVTHEGMLHITGITKNPMLTFHYVLFHIGNDPEDTEGCLLPGTKFGEDCVINSTLAYARAYNKIIEAFHENDPVWLNVSNKQLFQREGTRYE